MPDTAPPEPPVSLGPAAPSARQVTRLKNGLTLAALGVMVTLATAAGAALWKEWSALQAQLRDVRHTTIVGYAGIHPLVSFAKRPENWYHEEGEQTLLWSGWQHGVGHCWFRVSRGEVEKTYVSYPLGRDVIQAIDYPLVEPNDGPIGTRMPYDSWVVGDRLAGVETAYPLLVLDKVFVVNDTIQDRPFLVTYTARAPVTERVAIYEPVVGGQRVTMGLTGYFHEGKPLLYDRGTESFWVADGGALTAIAGKHKGTALKSVGTPTPTLWSRWRSDHPNGRLVVGADRSRAVPEL